MLIRYVDATLGAKTMEVVDLANAIIEEYEAQSITLTLRALYYRFVSRYPLALDPSGEEPNTLQNYKRLGSILNKARLAGHVSWEALEDRTRNLVAPSAWSSPAAILKAARDSFRKDLWKNQPTVVEVWIEKDAGIGTIEGVCDENGVAYFSCRGNTSQSEMWVAGRRIRKRWQENYQETEVLYIGDHDPNGVDMTRDCRDRLKMFAEMDVTVRRLGLNLDQIQLYNPPPNPVKNTDSRAKGYRAELRRLNLELSGDPDRPWDVDTCWELDALDPTVVRDLIQEAIDDIRDPELWSEALEDQETDRQRLDELLDTLES